MRLITLFLAAILGMAMALPMAEEPKILNEEISARNPALEQLIETALEALRDLMINGSGDIPVMDPFELQTFNINLGFIGLDDSHVAGSNMVVSQLSTFVVEELSVTRTSTIPLRYTLVLDARIPSLEMGAERYNMDVTVAGVNVFGEGEVKIGVIDPRIRASVEIGPRIFPPAPLVIFNANVAFHLEAFESGFTGLFGGDAFLNNFVNLFLQNLVPELVEFFEDDITTVVSQLVIDIGNDILSNLNISDLLPWQEELGGKSAHELNI